MTSVGDKSLNLSRTSCSSSDASTSFNKWNTFFQLEVATLGTLQYKALYLSDTKIFSRTRLVRLWLKSTHVSKTDFFLAFCILSHFWASSWSVDSSSWSYRDIRKNGKWNDLFHDTTRNTADGIYILWNRQMTFKNHWEEINIAGAVPPGSGILQVQCPREVEQSTCMVLNSSTTVYIIRIIWVHVWVP